MVMEGSRSSEPYLRPGEVAKLLGVSADIVRSWIRHGELEAVNVAIKLQVRPRYVVSRVALDRFEKHRAAKTVPRPRRRRKRSKRMPYHV